MYRKEFLNIFSGKNEGSVPKPGVIELCLCSRYISAFMQCQNMELKKFLDINSKQNLVLCVTINTDMIFVFILLQLQQEQNCTFEENYEEG